ncbi:MAG: Zn-ribbon domain-containing OB-fold protein [Kiloniellales bacterium]
MTELRNEPYGDPLSQPFWAAAERRELVVQRCRACGQHQFYPRPFCLACEGDSVEWVAAAGTGRVYSMTTLHVAANPDYEPPYTVAVVELDEGPRLVTQLLGNGTAIGDRVRVVWRERNCAPPLPFFEKLETAS